MGIMSYSRYFIYTFKERFRRDNHVEIARKTELKIEFLVWSIKLLSLRVQIMIIAVGENMTGKTLTL